MLTPMIPLPKRMFRSPSFQTKISAYLRSNHPLFLTFLLVLFCAPVQALDWGPKSVTALKQRVGQFIWTPAQFQKGQRTDRSPITRVDPDDAKAFNASDSFSCLDIPSVGLLEAAMQANQYKKVCSQVRAIYDAAQRASIATFKREFDRTQKPYLSELFAIDAYNQALLAP